MTIEKIIRTCHQFPVQFEGVVDGKPFYFRARWDEWSLQVNEDAAGNGLDGRVVAEGVGEPDPETAEQFVRFYLDHYSAGTCPHCKGTGRLERPSEGASKP